MHAHWRLHRQFLMWCAHVKGKNNKQVVEDPNVSQFNSHRFFFLNVVTRACAEYLNFLAKSPGAPSFDESAPILAKAEANIDFAWLCHFAHDAGFAVLDFLQAVRGNDSKLYWICSGASSSPLPTLVRHTRRSTSQWQSCASSGVWRRHRSSTVSTIAFARYRPAPPPAAAWAGKWPWRC